MRNKFNLKEMALGVIVRLVCMLLLGVLLVIGQTYLVKGGKFSVDLDINAFIHFITITVVGIVAGLVSREKNVVKVLVSAGVLYVLFLFIGGVICDGVGQRSIYGLLGGLTGVGVSLLASILQGKKSAKWKVKKYRC